MAAPSTKGSEELLQHGLAENLVPIFRSVLLTSFTEAFDKDAVCLETAVLSLKQDGLQLFYKPFQEELTDKPVKNVRANGVQTVKQASYQGNQKVEAKREKNVQV